MVPAGLIPTRRRAAVAGAILLAVLAGVVALAVAGGSGTARHNPSGGSATPPPSARPFTVTWVGDMSLSSRYGLPPLTGRGPFARVRKYLRHSDLTLGNLEGTLGSGGRSKCRPGATDCYTLSAPASYARLYSSAGFDVLNLANNHSYDFGREGQRQTIDALDRVRVDHAGEAGQIAVRRVRGTKVALLGFAPYPWAPSLLDIPAARRLVREAARRAQVVVVMIHAGAEGADQTHTPRGMERAFGEDRGDTRGFAHAVVAAGADLVVGSGPHVVRGVERYRDRLIAYSLGNFLSYRTLVQGGALSLSGILRVRLDGDGRPRAARWVSIRIVGAGTPEPDPTHESARLVTRVSREDFGARGVAVDRRGRLELPRHGG